jgi:small subunit ribosomal protein S2
MNVTPKDLLDAGVHLGHQTKRWNPRSKPYIFDHRQGISIIDLEKTHAALEKACAFIESLVAHGDDILLVGTKRQAQELIKEAATATGMPYVTNRWMGGTLTNFETIKKSLAKFKKYQAMDASGELAKFSSKEESAIRREMARMSRNFDGIISLTALPRAIFVIDTSYEEIAVAEAKRMNIPSIQAGLAHRESRRATPAETAAAATTGEIDLDKVIIPPSLKDVIEDKPVVKKRASRAGANKAAVTTDEV